MSLIRLTWSVANDAELCSNLVEHVESSYLGTLPGWSSGIQCEPDSAHGFGDFKPAAGQSLNDANLSAVKANTTGGNVLIIGVEMWVCGFHKMN